MAREPLEKKLIDESQIPVITPGNFQYPIEVWVQTETTPLLLSPVIEKIVTQHTPPIKEGDEVKSAANPFLKDVNEEAAFNAVEKWVKEEEEGKEEESSWRVASQVFIPFIIAGLGTVAAGILLDTVQHWSVFQAVPEMFVLVPALLGLKGNLEMTLASRVSTLANLGSVDSGKEQWKMVFGNLALLQCQSLVLGTVAAFLASTVGWIREGEFNIHSVLLLTSSSLVTASSASLLLGSLTLAVVIGCRKMGLDPDNIAAPLSASLGDVVTLGILASFASVFFTIVSAERSSWTEGCLVVGLLLTVPLWIWISYNNQFTRQVLISGWIPVLSAVAISSGGGYILNFAVVNFKEIASVQPVINGIGGNLVAVQACRISTYLHRHSQPGHFQSEDDLCVSPFTAWFGKSVHARTCRVLALLAIPGHLTFVTCVHLLKANSSEPLAVDFLCFYMIAALLQVALLLYFAHILVHWLWRWQIDPDDAAIPFLTAIGDLLGTALLFLAFLAIEEISTV